MPITVRHDPPNLLQQLLEYTVAGKQKEEEERLRQEAQAWEQEKFDRTMSLNEAQAASQDQFRAAQLAQGADQFGVESQLRAAQLAQGDDQFYAGLDAQGRDRALRAGMDERQLAYQDAWNRDKFSLDAAGQADQSAYNQANLALRGDENTARMEAEQRRLAEDAFQSDRENELEFAKQSGMTWGLTRDEKQANLNTQQQMRTVWQAQNLNAAEKQMAMQQLQGKIYKPRWLSKEESEPSVEEMVNERITWGGPNKDIPFTITEDGVPQVVRGYQKDKPEQDKNQMTDKDIAGLYNDAFKALTKKNEDGSITTPNAGEIEKYVVGLQQIQKRFRGGALGQQSGQSEYLMPEAKPVPEFKVLTEQYKQAGYQVIEGMVGPDGYPVVRVNGELVQVKVRPKG